MRSFRLTATFTFVAAVPIAVHLDTGEYFPIGPICAFLFALGLGFAAWVIDGIMSAGRRDARPPKTL